MCQSEFDDGSRTDITTKGYMSSKKPTQQKAVSQIENLPDENPDSGQVTFLSFYDRTLMDFAQKMLTNDLEVLRSFASRMITLLISLFPVYFVVLEFMDVSSKKNPFLIVSSVWISIALLVSLLVFVFTLVPTKDKFSPIDLNSIEEFRERIIQRKRKYTMLALFTLSLTLLSMMVQFLVILYS